VYRSFLPYGRSSDTVAANRKIQETRFTCCKTGWQAPKNGTILCQMQRWCGFGEGLGLQALRRAGVCCGEPRQARMAGAENSF
jgi:hypothetical protein